MRTLFLATLALAFAAPAAAQTPQSCYAQLNVRDQMIGLDYRSERYQRLSNRSTRLMYQCLDAIDAIGGYRSPYGYRPVPAARDISREYCDEQFKKGKRICKWDNAPAVKKAKPKGPVQKGCAANMGGGSVPPADSPKRAAFDQCVRDMTPKKKS